MLIIGLNQTGLILYDHFPADRLGIMLMAIERSLGVGMFYFVRNLKYAFTVVKTQVKKSNNSLS